jgi:ATPase subunit of ABC transporter with duplicated ATPase domains
MDTMPASLKMDFVEYIEELFPPMLLGITGAKDADEDPALKAAKALVHRFGGLCPEYLLSAFESCYQAMLEEKNMTVARERSVVLLGQMVDKILEHKKFGQDLLTTELSSQEFREELLSLIFLCRSDPDSGVKRVANGIWKTAGGAPKVQKAIMPTLEKKLLQLRKGEQGPTVQKIAVATFAELEKAGELEAPTDELPAATKFAFKPTARAAPQVVDIVAGKLAEGDALGEGATKEGNQRIMKIVEEHFAELNGFQALPKEGQRFCCVVASSVAFEGERQKMNGMKVVEKMVATLKEVLGQFGDSASALDPSEVAEKICKAVLGAAFDQQEAAGIDEDTLMKIDDLMLMYGAGHLLLKDTTLICKKNRRYGVVGHNGAGKTTLMKEMVNFRLNGMPSHLKVVHVDDSKLGLMSKSSLNALEYVVAKGQEIGVTDAGAKTLKAVGFPEEMNENPVAELSTGWRMRLTLAVAMLKHADILLLDEPTNHLDEESVDWLAEYLMNLTKSSVIVISHEPRFLNKVCTDIMSYQDKKLVYTEGNFDAFVMSKGIKKEDIEALLSGNLSLDTKTDEEEGSEEGADEGKKEKRASVTAPISGPPKISFPIPGSVEGVKSSSRAVLELKNVSFRYGKDKDYLIEDVSGKLCLGSRVAICGRNGCGKSTLMTLICSELNATEGKEGKVGDVIRHCNLRLAYMKQDHLKVLEPYFDTSPLVYISQRFQNGYDEELQKRLIEPEDEEEAERRKKLAKEFGKYGNEVETLVSRSKQGNTMVYEVKWKNLDDSKMNTLETITKLRQMGMDKAVIACDERIAAKAAGLDQRPLTRREIVKHCEAFGIDEEMCCNRQIRGFSAGQKVRLSLAAMFWTKPHFICVDEPTNYLDVETVDALAKALQGFRGGIVMIEPKTHFMEKICNETWTLENGAITVAKLNNGVKRAA